VLFERLWGDLKSNLDYLPEDELDKAANALQLAYGAHKGQKRKSGDPFIVHPVAVACILGELRMDVDSVVAGLLHDVVEDTDKASFDDIEAMFGVSVRNIVEGETRVSKLHKHKHDDDPPGSIEDDQTYHASVVPDTKSHDLQQLFVAMTEEIRIIIVKLADRLHNMRTLCHMPKHKQKKIGQETLTIFAPLANLLGLFAIGSELEELSFYFTEREEYLALRSRVRLLFDEQKEVLDNARKDLGQVLRQDKQIMGLVDRIEVRTATKSLYSLHKKLRARGLQLRDVRDIAQLVVVAYPVGDANRDPIGMQQQMSDINHVCYHILGRVHSTWAPIPGSFKDFVATPKPNNYQSIHTSVIPLGAKYLFPIQVQIRTKAMDEIAENGYAAHMNLKHSSHHGAANLAGSPTTPLTNGNGNTSSSSPTSISPVPSSSAATPASSVLRSEDVWQTSWLNSVREWQEEFGNGKVTAKEFVETVVGDFLPRTVFVFTPDGNVVSVAKGSTVVDFAYQMHTDVGHQMLMARVNGVPTHPSHELTLAEVVEIVRHQGPPTPDVVRRQKEYLSYAKLRSTRHKIARFIKQHAHLLASANVDKASVARVLSRRFSEDELAVMFAAPYEPGEIIWLILRCRDRSGVLAKVAGIISKSDLSIKVRPPDSNVDANVC